MDHARQLSLVEDAESNWGGSHASADSPGRVFNPFIGVCVGLAMGLFTWGVLALLWYAVTS